MNVFLLYPFADLETGVAIKEAFEALNHKVCCVDAREQTEDAFHIFTQGKFDLVLCCRDFACYEPVARMKKYDNNVITACWNNDPRKDILEWGPAMFLFEFVDYYFDKNEGQIEDFKEWNKNSYFLPQALNDKRFYPVKATELQKQRYTCEAGFIGNIIEPFHERRVELLQSINEVCYFKHMTDVHGYEHNCAVDCIKVNVSHSVNPEVSNSFTVRNWKILGAGGVGLDLYHEGGEGMFHGGIEFYKTIEEAPDKVRYILSHYDEYKDKALKARKYILKHGTYRNRIKDMLRIIRG